MAKLTMDRMRDAIPKLYGNMTAIAKRFKVTRQNVHAFIQRHPELKELVELARESLVDIAENQMAKDAAKDDPKYQPTRIFIASTLGRHRGWRKGVEVTGAGGGPIATNNTTTVNGTITVGVQVRLDELSSAFANAALRGGGTEVGSAGDVTAGNATAGDAVNAPANPQVGSSGLGEVLPGLIAEACDDDDDGSDMPDNDDDGSEED